MGLGQGVSGAPGTQPRSPTWVAEAQLLPSPLPPECALAGSGTEERMGDLAPGCPLAPWPLPKRRPRQVLRMGRLE